MFASSKKSKIFAAALFATGFGLPSASLATENITVHMNMARVLRLSAPAATIIIGNPGIADVTIQDPTTLILTGKSYGQTNLIALDSAGNPIADSIILVQRGSSDIVTVYVGAARTSMSCTPDCQPIIQVGDDVGFTRNTINSSAIIAGNAN